jgi:hypothetical protein
MVFHVFYLGCGGAAFVEKTKTPPPGSAVGLMVLKSSQHPAAALLSSRALVSSSPVFTFKFTGRHLSPSRWARSMLISEQLHQRISSYIQTFDIQQV